jgi:hypothetical protein
MRRLFWLGVGAAAGASGTIWTQRRVKEQLDNLGPDAVVAVAGRGARALGRTLSAAVSEGRAAMAEGRAAMAEREEELTRDFHAPRGRGRGLASGWPASTPGRPYR